MVIVGHQHFEQKPPLKFTKIESLLRVLDTYAHHPLDGKLHLNPYQHGNQWGPTEEGNDDDQWPAVSGLLGSISNAMCYDGFLFVSNDPASRTDQ